MKKSQDLLQCFSVFINVEFYILYLNSFRSISPLLHLQAADLLFLKTTLMTHSASPYLREDSRARTEIFINFVSHEQTFYHSALLPRKSKNFPFLLSTWGQNCSGCRAGGPLCTSPVRPSHRRTVNSTLWTYRRIDLFTWNHYLCNAYCYQHRNKTTCLYLQSKVKHAFVINWRLAFY